MGLSSYIGERTQIWGLGYLKAITPSKLGAKDANLLAVLAVAARVHLAVLACRVLAVLAVLAVLLVLTLCLTVVAAGRHPILINAIFCCWPI